LRVSGYSEAEVARMIEHAFSSRWFSFTYRPKNIVDNYDILAKDLKLPVRPLAPEPEKKKAEIDKWRDPGSLGRQYESGTHVAKDDRQFDWDAINEKML
jgi:hypothetical protein